jgi:hypothetical protein
MGTEGCRVEWLFADMFIYIWRTEADLVMEPIPMDSILRHLRNFPAAEKDERKWKKVVTALVRVFFVH